MPQVTWRKGPSLEPLSGRPGVVVLDDGSLFLSLVSLTDGGDYECQATNEVGSVSRRTKLLVYGKRGPDGHTSRAHSDIRGARCHLGSQRRAKPAAAAAAAAARQPPL